MGDTPGELCDASNDKRSCGARVGYVEEFIVISGSGASC